MSYLLDTHTLLWWLDNNCGLSENARQAIATPDNGIFVSAASAWEISSKQAIGKLNTSNNLATLSYDLIIITRDSQFEQYGVRQLKA